MSDTYAAPGRILKNVFKDATGTALNVAELANTPTGRNTLRKVLNTNKELIRSSFNVAKMGSGFLGKAFLNKKFLKNVICAKTSFPIGMLHKLMPLSFCLPPDGQKREDTTQNEQSKQTTKSDFAYGSYKLDTTKDPLKNSKMFNLQNTTISSVKKVLQKFIVENSINISTDQRSTINCPSELLDNNPIMRRMADVRPYGETDVWKPALVNITTCSNGEDLQFKDSNGNTQYDTCDPVDASELVFFDKSKKKSIPDKGGWNVEYSDGSRDSNIREFDENGVRNIRYVYGCCPVTEQLATIKVQEIKGDMKKIQNEVRNQIDTMSKHMSSFIGCKRDNLGVETTMTQEADIEIRNTIQHLVEHTNKQTVVAAQNINYTDYYQTCFKGGPRVIKQSIDIDTLSVNIVKSSIKTLFDNQISLEAESETKIQIYYESFTPRILIFSFLLNMIILFISFLVISKLIKKLKK